jgi:hypothetical protein
MINEKEFNRHVESLISMSTDYLAGDLGRDIYVANLGILAGLMEAKTPLGQCTCDLCTGSTTERDAYGGGYEEEGV